MATHKGQQFIYDRWLAGWTLDDVLTEIEVKAARKNIPRSALGNAKESAISAFVSIDLKFLEWEIDHLDK